MQFVMLIQKNENRLNISCVIIGEMSNWGISWAGKDSGKIECSGFQIPPGEDLVELFPNNNKLHVKKTMGFPLPIAMDSRWNGFPIYRGASITTVNITGSGINLSSLGPSLTIFLNGTLGTLITVKINGTTVTINDQPQSNMNRSNFEWFHFQLSWFGKTLEINDETGQIILKYERDSEIRLTTATFILDESSTVVLHEYFWYDAKNLTFKSNGCHMLYFAMCKTCVLDLRVNNKVERITGVGGKWTQKKLTEFCSVSTIGTNKGGNVEREYFAVVVRKCPSGTKMNTLSASFEAPEEIKCYSFCNGKGKVISYGNGTVVELLGKKKFNKIRRRSNLYHNNIDLIICTVEDKCYVPKNICQSNHLQKSDVYHDAMQKLDVQVYCQTMDNFINERPVNVSVKWKTPPADETLNYLFKFCEDASPDVCYELSAKQCDITTWKNYTCSSAHLKINFNYNLLIYTRLYRAYIPKGCWTYNITERDNVPLKAAETVEGETLVLKVTNSRGNIVATQLKLTLENDTDVHFYSSTEKGILVYKLTETRSSATYKVALHVQTDCGCTDSQEIKVRTPPARLMVGEPPALKCTLRKCLIQVGRSKQASANSSLLLFVSDASNETSPKVTVGDQLENCHRVYDTTRKKWTLYKKPPRITYQQNIPLRDESTRINFDIQADNVSSYKIEVLLINRYYDKATCTLYGIDTEGRDRKSVVNPKLGDEGVKRGIIVACALCLILIAAATFVIYKKKLWERLPNYVNIRSNNGSRVSEKPRSKRVQVNDLEEYVKRALRVPRGSEDELSYQFKLCSPGQTHPWTCGKLPGNSKKHRYKNILAYDHSRVVLSKLPGDDFSDYINANYVGERMYIATQGPKRNTTNDFWRMVWEQNCPVIIMLTKFVENDKPKCEKYWPDDSKTYGEITVSLTSQQYQADYCCRTFNLCKGTINRQLTHLHYELWPDHGVPDCQSLAAFMAVIPPLKPTRPQIVHCSAGCGRTGTLILAQMCLKSAHQTGQVDFLHSLATIRKCRVDLVQNEEQYKVAHLLLLEILFKQDYAVMCDARLIFAIANRKADAVQQLRYLNNVCWRDTALFQGNLEDEINRENIEKNRFPLIIPPQHSAVVILRDPITDVHSDYINAVLIEKFYDSISSQNFEEVEADYANMVALYSSAEYIVTQQPLPHTVKDFWRMVLDKEAEIVVSLNKISLQDQSSCIFWPQNGREIRPTSACKLRFIQRLFDNEGYDVVTLHAESKNIAKTILLVNMKNWNAEEFTPKFRSHLLELVKYIQALSTAQVASDHPIIVTCHDGATASGLFLSLITMLEMIRIENKFDLCRVVRSIRKSRKEFMRKIEQFDFLYNSVMDYLDNHLHTQQVVYSNKEALYSN